MHIRPAELADAPALTAIYNAGSAAKPAANLVTWQEDVSDREEWLKEMFKAGSPVFVAVHDDEVIGWAAYFQFVTPAIYYGTVEDSVYIAPSAQGKGVGSELLDALMDFAADDAYVVDVKKLHHKNPLTPYQGKALAGVVRRTWLHGEVIDFENPRGRLLRRGMTNA